ncbi:unnamed protein product [Ceratitis capitata]|uniref:(Mediterranean fruit fly) hypothetical protein n=1 Tax=Ceratitis capitata TaxID=7213 RepID=A0A811VFG1_CERCA|nr:unnamed protein product [Ceratitis capitata]
MADGAFKSRDIGLRAQKKILSRMATKNIAKTLLMVQPHRFLITYIAFTGNKVKAEKLIKNIIKNCYQNGVLHRNNQFSAEELKDAEVVLSENSNFDLPYLQKSIAESHAALKSIVQRHLTEKSLNRIDEVFDFFRDTTLLEAAFKPDSQYRELMERSSAT